MRVVGARPGLLVEARHGFQVVVHHVGEIALEGLQRDLQSAAKIGHQHFDFLRDAGGEVAGAAVLEVVAVDAGDHHVLELHGRNGFGELLRLVLVGRQRFAVADVAERAAARA